ncbi:hypothetical protein C2E23DRAFT_814204 [Lenzites betulinus]|nr:hypothetical protein C2E23DRAFT_814204 [Lenzites betulinus]
MFILCLHYLVSSDISDLSDRLMSGLGPMRALAARAEAGHPGYLRRHNTAVQPKPGNLKGW